MAISRRHFLQRSLAGAGVLSLPQGLLADPPSPVFPLGVASADPQPNGVTLWTKVDPEAVPGAGAAIPLEYQIGLDPSFPIGGLVKGFVEARESSDYTAKITVQNPALWPFFQYYYRFRQGDNWSPVGRFKTLPAPGQWIPSLRLGFLSCQDYTNGYFTALQALAVENVDYVIHLGDYIYESVGDPRFQQSQIRPIGALPSGGDVVQTLEDYRFLYRTYRRDPSLRALHQSAAFIQIWDDHEFQNDSFREFHPDNTSDPTQPQPELRKAANQAWSEYTATPIAFDPNQGPLDFQIYRRFDFGDLARLVATDERLYRDGPPCGFEDLQRQITFGCPEVSRPDRTMLGATQRSWFLDQMNNSGAIWNVWANEVLVMPLKLGYGDPLLLTLDGWDGYPAERHALMAGLQNVQNLAAITGDLHSFIAGHLYTDFDNIFSPRVGVEIMGGSACSANFADILAAPSNQSPPNAPVGKSQLDAAFPDGLVELLVRLNNPHIEYFNSSRHGYGVVDLGRWSMRCKLRAVASVTQPTAAVETIADFTVLKDWKQLLRNS